MPRIASPTSSYLLVFSLCFIGTCLSFHHGVGLGPQLRGSNRIATSRLAHGSTRTLKTPCRQTQMLAEIAEPIQHAMYLAAMTPTTFHDNIANSLLRDTLTGTGVYYLGQRSKGLISDAYPRWEVLGRWMIMGTLDGVCRHMWYQSLEQVVGNLGLDSMSSGIVMAAATSFLYYPFFCAQFLGGMSLLEGKGLQEARKSIQQDFASLFKPTLPTWGLFHVGLFTFVDLDLRVTVAMAAYYASLIVQALSNEGAFAALKQTASAANFKQDLQDLPNSFAEQGLSLAVSYRADPPQHKDIAEV